MYAIIRTGGKQAKVQEGELIEVDRLKGAGEEIIFTPLLVVDGEGNAISDREQLQAIKVRARLVGETLGPKIDILKYKNKSGYRRRQGHRQKYTTLEITAIEIPAVEKAAKAEED